MEWAWNRHTGYQMGKLGGRGGREEWHLCFVVPSGNLIDHEPVFTHIASYTIMEDDTSVPHQISVKYAFTKMGNGQRWQLISAKEAKYWLNVFSSDAKEVMDRPRMKLIGMALSIQNCKYCDILSVTHGITELVSKTRIVEKDPMAMVHFLITFAGHCSNSSYWFRLLRLGLTFRLLMHI